MTMRSPYVKYILFISTILVWSLSVTAANQADIRILIDVSGSMKINDPNNLRQPALRLLTGLLPLNSTAGVWTFGQYVNMLVGHGLVTKSWKDSARKASREIKSYGLFTNIEDTLYDATWDWKEPIANQQRSLILLTDGLVDISKDPAVNLASRKRILDEILPRLQQAGVKIHTIALSENADKLLLSQLSSATQGYFALTTTAAELERVFLRMFEASIESETLPIQGKTINVDNSIQEMTLLIFRQQGSSPTRITLPDGSSIDQQHTNTQTSWYSEENYDLITVQKPIAGIWTIEADMDPDNRVLVVTDLHMHSDKLPRNITLEEQPQINIRFSENDKPIINKDFLHFIKVTAILYNKLGRQEQHWAILDNGLRNDLTENDGIYTLVFDKALKTGRHELVIDVDGTTFSRQHRQHFEVFKDPVISSIETSKEGSISLYISPISGLIDPESLNITATVNAETTARPVARIHHNEWQLKLDDLDTHSHHTLVINIQGQRNSQEINLQLDPISFGAAAKIEIMEEPSPDAHSHAPVLVTENTASGEDKNSPAEDNPAEDNKETNTTSSTLFIMLIVFFFNAAIAAILFILYRKYKKNRLAAGQSPDILTVDMPADKNVDKKIPEELAHE